MLDVFPTNLIDKSGYCAGDPSDPNNPDTACWTELHRQEDYYGINLTGDWHLDELLDLLLGLWDLEFGLGGIEYFRAAFTGITLERIQGVKTGPENFAARAGSASKIEFWDMAFELEQVASRWLISHEFGHIWDARNLLTQSYNFESATGGQSCLTEIVTKCRYRPGGTVISDLGDNNRRDDFAESFAAAMFRGDMKALSATGMHGGIRPDTLTVAADRIAYVKSSLSSFRHQVDWQRISSAGFYAPTVYYTNGQISPLRYINP